MADEQVIGDRDRLDLYKMEYEHCVARYRNIYEEMWKIFSYLAAISAGMLVFGREHFSVGITTAISMLPLLFWFLGVFLPLDRYGQSTLDRLAALECQLTKPPFGACIQHFTIMAGHVKWKLKHEKYGLGWRVRHAAWVFFVIVLSFFCLGLVGRWRNWFPRATASPVVHNAQVTGNGGPRDEVNKRNPPRSPEPSAHTQSDPPRDGD